MEKLKKRVVIVLSFMVLVIIVMVATGYDYLFKAARVAAMHGRFDNSIYDFKYYDTREIKTGKAQPWPLDKQYNKVAFSPEFAKEIEDYKTKAFLIIRDGKILKEQYFGDYTKNTPSCFWSITKTYTTLAILKAIDDGLIKSVDEPLYSYVPEWNVEQKPVLTLRHLASMTAGFEWNELNPGPFTPVAKLIFCDDVNNMTLKVLNSVKNPPGAVQNYNSAGTQLLGMVLDNVLKNKTLSDYISEKFWKPLGCETPGLYMLDGKQHMQEEAFGGMAATARDLSRMGQLVLNNGVWKGDTILKPQYIQLIKTLPYNNKSYTYGIWTSTYNYKPVYYLAGSKGQFCIVFPVYNLVITRLGEKDHGKEHAEDNSKEIFIYIKEAIRMCEESDKMK